MGRVGGKVTDDDGNPLVGAALVAEQPGTSAKYEATTDEDGRYNINGLRGGDWLITASMDGYLPTQGNFRVTTLSRVPPITFKLEKGVEGPLGALSGVDTTAIQADLQTADLLFNAGQYAAAIGVGMTNLEKGDFAAAEVTLAAAAETAEASAEVFYNLGEVKFISGESDVAAGWYQRAVDKDPAWGKPLFKLALVALNKEDYEGATQYLQKLQEVDPTSAEAQQATAVLQQLANR